MSLNEIAGQMLAQTATDERAVNPKQIGVGLALTFGIGGYIGGQWRKAGKSEAGKTARLWFILGTLMLGGLALALRGMQ
ncbi:hypothetical protein [Streptomyces sp. SID3343]|uniref:hypothetical protein n=1 Tax=Streptomyces sp. SID3343 TaxID=2690260 RepID=UPI001367F5AD|nr:hypothetical protein [Streptomyces sp. SID3343]MYW03478.1 hypothetical protein [Streptomyces sp. SID3343]